MRAARDAPGSGQVRAAWRGRKLTRTVVGARRGSRTAAGEHVRQPVDGTTDRRRIPLFVDPGPDELEVEATGVPGVEHVADDALERDVAVAGNQAVRCRHGGDGEVAHLDQAQRLDPVADRRDEIAFGPARVDLHADTGAEPPGEVD